MGMFAAKDYDKMSSLATGVIMDRLKNKPKVVLGLATGAFPRRTYWCLKEAYRLGMISLRG